jgi:hypothetical protein
VFLALAKIAIKGPEKEWSEWLPVSKLEPVTR